MASHHELCLEHACLLPHAPSPTQLIVVFKPGATRQQRSKTFVKASVDKKRLLRQGDETSGHVTLVTVKMNPSESNRTQLRDAAARIKSGESHTGALIAELHTSVTAQAPYHLRGFWSMDVPSCWDLTLPRKAMHVPSSNALVVSSESRVSKTLAAYKHASG